MNVAWDIAVRYLRTGRQGYVSFITWVSFLGLMLGVLVLTVVVSVMNGFDHELKTRLLQAIPHVVIEDLENLSKETFDDPDVLARYPYFETIGMVGRGSAVQPVSLLGLDAAGLDAMQEVGAGMTSGELETLLASPGSLIIGAPLARHLGLGIGDRVALTLPAASGGKVRPQVLAFTLGGTFSLGSELDYGLVLVAMRDIPESIRASSGEHGVQLRLRDPLDAERVRSKLQLALPQAGITTWMERYGELFRAVQLEKAMMFVLLLLVVTVAAFNIVSGQVMLIREKAAAIAILRTMGARASQVATIFLIQGIMIAAAGIFSGLILGVLATININQVVGALESLFGVSFLEGTYFVEIPFLIQGLDLGLIGGLAAGICLIAAWIPARRAKQVHPVQGLHGF